MQREHEVPQNDRGFWIGILIGLSIVMSVFAATSAEPFGVFDMLMLVLAALLIVGIAVHAVMATHPAGGLVWYDASATDAAYL